MKEEDRGRVGSFRGTHLHLYLQKKWGGVGGGGAAPRLGSVVEYSVRLGEKKPQQHRHIWGGWHMCMCVSVHGCVCVHKPGRWLRLASVCRVSNHDNTVEMIGSQGVNKQQVSVKEGGWWWGRGEREGGVVWLHPQLVLALWFRCRFTINQYLDSFCSENILFFSRDIY